MVIRVERFAYLPSATLGVLSVEGQDWQCYTMEREWAGNARGRSCIPTGTYKAALSMFNRGGYECVELEGVDGRSEILIHKANLAAELQGCIAPGLTLGTLRGALAVLDSGRAFRRLMETVAGAGELTVEVGEDLRRWGPKS